MKVAYVVSDLSFPPREGLHQQSLVHLAALRLSGHVASLRGFVKLAENQIDATTQGPATNGGDALLSVRSGPSLLSGLVFAFTPRWLLPPTVKGLIAELNSVRFDVVHLEGISACGLAVHLQTPVVVSLVDPGSRRFSRLRSRNPHGIRGLSAFVTAKLHFTLERRLSALGEPFHVVSPEDAIYIQQAHNRAALSIPVSLPRELEAVGAQVSSTPEPNSPVRIVIYGDFRQTHMRDALERFLKDDIQSVKAVHLHIILLGRIPSDATLDFLFAGFSSEIVEWVEDYVGLLCSADLVILPDQLGTGLKNRAIQCLALGVCVVGTPVAFEGIPAEDMVHAAIGDESGSLEARLQELVLDATARAQIGRAGAKLARSLYGSRIVANAWTAAYELAIERHGGGS